jgi:DNA-directed RNA polymerase specialized sigma24 family protein
MPTANSITVWIRRLASGDQAAVEPIWKRFFRRMTGLARKQLDSAPVPRGEEEDVALSAFHQFCRAALDNRFPNIGGRRDLWHLLAALTARKAVDHYRAMAALKRKPGESEPLHENIAIARSPDPALQAVLADEIRSLFTRLGDESLQTVAEMKLNGLSNDEIAAQLGCTVRTVHRRIGMIRDIWEGAGPDGNSEP